MVREIGFLEAERVHAVRQNRKQAVSCFSEFFVGIITVYSRLGSLRKHDVDGSENVI